jgi:hypothetical protein
VGHIDPVFLVRSILVSGTGNDDSEPEDVTVSDRDLLAQRFETHREPVQE